MMLSAGFLFLFFYYTLYKMEEIWVGCCLLVGKASGRGKVIEHQKGAKGPLLSCADGSPDASSGAFGLFNGTNDLCDGSLGRHFGSCEMLFWCWEVVFFFWNCFRSSSSRLVQCRNSTSSRGFAKGEFAVVVV